MLGPFRKRFGIRFQADPVRYGTGWIIKRTIVWVQNFRGLLLHQQPPPNLYCA